MSEPSSPPPSGAPRWLGWVAIALFLGTGLFYLAAGLLVPVVGLIVLWLIWLAGLVGTIVWARRQPGWSLLAPVIAVGFWFAYVSLGSAVFGWTA